MAGVSAPIGLRLSEAKTSVCHIDDGFDFLGFRIQRKRKRGSNKRFVYTFASEKSVQHPAEGEGTNPPVDVRHDREVINRLNDAGLDHFKHAVI